MDSFCPLHIDLRNRDCLVIGGGNVASRKVKVMLSFKARVTVVSPSLGSHLEELLSRGSIEYLADLYRPAYLKNRFLVICAAYPSVNRSAALACREMGILVNTVSEPEYCTFFLPAMLKKGALTLSVSSGGSSPALARRIRDQLEENLPPEYGDLLLFLHEVRPLVMKRVSDKKLRRELLKYLAGEEFLNRFKSLERSEAAELVEKMISEIET